MEGCDGGFFCCSSDEWIGVECKLSVVEKDSSLLEITEFLKEQVQQAANAMATMEYSRNGKTNTGTRTAMLYDDLSIGEVSSLGNSVADDIGYVAIERKRKILEKKDMDADLAWDTTMMVDTEPYRSKNSSISSWLCCLACD